jgi:hypothetical protein
MTKLQDQFNIRIEGIDSEDGLYFGMVTYNEYNHEWFQMDNKEKIEVRIDYGYKINELDYENICKLIIKEIESR